MRRTLLKFAPFCSRHFLSPPPVSNPNPICSLLLPSTSPSSFRFFSSDNDDDYSYTPKVSKTDNIGDVDTKKFKGMINEFLTEGNEEAIPSILEAILARKLSGKHDESDNELMEELGTRPPLDDVSDVEFDSDLDIACETDEEVKRMVSK